MVEIYSCRFFYSRTSSWSQPKQLLNNYFKLKLLLLHQKHLFNFKTQIFSSLLTLQTLEVIAHVNESILVYGHTLTNCNILYSQYIS